MQQHAYLAMGGRSEARSCRPHVPAHLAALHVCTLTKATHSRTTVFSLRSLCRQRAHYGSQPTNAVAVRAGRLAAILALHQDHRPVAHGGGGEGGGALRLERAAREVAPSQLGAWARKGAGGRGDQGVGVSLSAQRG